MSWQWLLIVWQVVAWGVRVLMVPVILHRRFATGTALSWLGIIFLLPEIGVPLYLLVGVSHLGKRRAASHRQVVSADKSKARLEAVRSHPMTWEVAPEQRNMVRQLMAMSRNAIVGGNDVQPITQTDELIRRLINSIDSAQHHAHLLYYIYWDDGVGRAVSEALMRAAGRGVVCRLLVDAAASRRFLKSALCRQMRQAGVAVRDALPVSLWRKRLARIDLRNHRKIAVIDGRIAYAGSHNIVEEDYGHKWAGKWVDLTGQFTGPIVAQFQAVFLDDWAFETGQDIEEDAMFPTAGQMGDVSAQVVPTGPSYEGETFRRVLVAAISGAQRKVVMTTPYLVPDEPTMLALSMATARGVEVTIIVPKRSDHPLVGAAGRAYIEPLLEAGVSIYQYQRGLLHAKTLTVDDAFAMLGSANLDVRSFLLNFELSTMLYGEQITRQMRFVQQSYLNESTELSLEEWQRRPSWKLMLEDAAALMSPLL